MIEVINLCKSYGKLEVIKNLDLKVEKGEVMSIIGLSGSGKTSLLRCITGLDTYFTGEINIDKISYEEYFKSNRIAIVLQKYSNFSWLNVKQNIETAFINQVNKPNFEQDEIVNRLLLDLDLWKFSNNYINQLSGGMQQRVAVARAIAQGTEILAFDEPFGALDISNRNKLQLLFKELNKKFQKTVLFITHDIEEAIFVSDKVAVLSKSPSQVVKIFESVHKAEVDTSIKYDPSFVSLKKQVEAVLHNL